MPKGYLKGHKEYSGAYKGQGGKGYPKTVTNDSTPMKSPSFRPMGIQPTQGKAPKKKSHNPGY